MWMNGLIIIPVIVVVVLLVFFVFLMLLVFVAVVITVVGAIRRVGLRGRRGLCYRFADDGSCCAANARTNNGAVVATDRMSNRRTRWAAYRATQNCASLTRTLGGNGRTCGAAHCTTDHRATLPSH